MAKKEKELSIVERLAEMNAKGIQQTMPGTERVIRVKTVNAVDLLRSGNIPDILTPLIVKSVYQELNDSDTRRFLEQSKERIEDALAHLEAIDYICEKAITDGTKVKDLTIGEKRWIFRLVLGPAELLITFRLEQEYDVEAMDESQDVQPATV